MSEKWQQAWVEVLPDFKQFRGKANAEMTTVLGSAGTSAGIAAGNNAGAGILGGIKGIAGPLVAVVAALGIGDLIGRAIGAGINYAVDAVGLASDLEQSMGAVDSVFKDASGSVKDFASNSAQNLGLSRTAYLKFATVTGAQLKNLGIPMDQVAGKTDDLISLGADLAAQFGGDTATAVQAISSLLRGETDPIEQFGVSIKQSDINARLAAQGLTDLTGEAEKQARIAATLAILWEQTADAQGTFASESDTLAGAQSILAAKFSDAQTKFGEALAPIATQLLDIAASEVLPQLEGFLSDSGPAFAEALQDALPDLKTLVGQLVDAGPTLTDFAVETLPKLVSGLQDLLNISSGLALLGSDPGKFFTEFLGITNEVPGVGSTGDGGERTGISSKDFWAAKDPNAGSGGTGGGGGGSPSIIQQNYFPQGLSAGNAADIAAARVNELLRTR